MNEHVCLGFNGLIHLAPDQDGGIPADDILKSILMNKTYLNIKGSIIVCGLSDIMSSLV